MFQAFNLFPHMSVIDNVTLAPRKVLGLSRVDAEARAMELLERIGLAAKRDDYPTGCRAASNSASRSSGPSRCSPTSCCSTRSRAPSTRSLSPRSSP